MPRLYVDAPLTAHTALELPPGAARHVQVLRMQPGAALTVFDGRGGEFDATVTHMGRSSVAVQVGEHHATEREAAVAVHLALAMPANDRMDWLVEKAAELGVASVQPLVSQHSVLRLSGERAAKKQAHWQSIATAACEQCGRNCVPAVHPVLALSDWLRELPPGAAEARWLLSFDARAVAPRAGERTVHRVLSGPEGGLSATEEALAAQQGFAFATLGPRVLRADTAPLAMLCALTLP